MSQPTDEAAPHAKSPPSFWKRHSVKTTSLAILAVLGVLGWMAHNDQHRLGFIWKSLIQQQVGQKKKIRIISHHQQTSSHYQQTSSHHQQASSHYRYSITQVDIDNLNRQLNLNQIQEKPIQYTYHTEKLPAKADNINLKQKPLTINRPYTIQLMSSIQQELIEDYRIQHNLLEVSDIRETKHHGHSWFILTYGHFTSLSAARTALNTLQGNIKQMHPWARSVSHFRLVKTTNKRDS